MIDQSGIDRTVADCEQFWLQTGVPRRMVAEMKAELSAHLHEAIAAGKGMETVIGTDLAEFAESWAIEHRGPTSDKALESITAQAGVDRYSGGVWLAGRRRCPHRDPDCLWTEGGQRGRY